MASLAGVAVGESDNSSGAAGDKTVEVFAEGVFELTGASLAQASVGQAAYATDNYTVAADYAAGGVRIGEIVE